MQKANATRQFSSEHSGMRNKAIPILHTITPNFIQNGAGAVRHVLAYLASELQGMPTLRLPKQVFPDLSFNLSFLTSFQQRLNFIFLVHLPP